MKKIIVLFIILIFGSYCAAETSTEKITLKAAIDLAVKNNIDYAANKLDINIAKNSIKTANSLQNPDFNVFYNFGKAGEGNPQQIGISETIEIAKRSARKKLAKANLELAKENTAYFEFDLKMDVREAYVNQP